MPKDKSRHFTDNRLPPDCRMPKDKSSHSLLHNLPSFRTQMGDYERRQSSPLLNPPDAPPIARPTPSPDRRRAGPYRRTLGGRGREWAGESLKLLEALLELEDSKPVREPVNPLNYPDYYIDINNPLDLSKIMLKFHGGNYASLMAFAKDMHQMFSNYKQFFKTANPEIYTQVHRLSWWFEAELTRINDKWGKPPGGALPYKNGQEPPPQSPLVSPVPLAYPSHPPDVDNFTLRQRLEASRAYRAPSVDQDGGRGYRPGSSDQEDGRGYRPPSSEQGRGYRPPGSDQGSGIPYRHSAPSGNELPFRKRRKSRDVSASRNSMDSILMNHCSMMPQLEVDNDDRIPSILPRPSPTEIHPHPDSNLQFQSSPLSQLRPSTVAQLSGARKIPRVRPVPRSSPSPNTTATTSMDTYRPSMSFESSARSNVPDVAVSYSASPQTSVADSTPGTRVTKPPGKTGSPRIPRLPLNNLMMELNVSNIWFGTARIKPKKLALLSETGLQISLNYGDDETPFTIHADEIIRCVAHFGRNSNKHTLFIFVLPSCSKRLEALNIRYTNCSMIVIFINTPSITGISTLIHIFWTIGKNSLFGNLFSEVDQKGALMLLGNIKPGILTRVTIKYKNSTPGQEQQGMPDLPSLVGEDSNPLTEENTQTSRRKRKSTPSRIISANHVTTGEDSVANPPTAERSSPLDGDAAQLPDSSVASTRETDPERLLNPEITAPLDKLFAERLGASLQNSFKEGLTEVMKTLTDSLYKKAVGQKALGPPVDRAPASGSDKSQSDATQDSQEGATEKSQDGTTDKPDNATMEVDDESDIEIVLPSDSEEETVAGHNNKTDQQQLGEEEEEELAVTGESVSLRCPITQQIMTNPVKNKHCNHSYDKPGVEHVISNRTGKARCPVPGCSNTTTLDMDDMLPDEDLRKQIDDKNSQLLKSSKKEESKE